MKRDKDTLIKRGAGLVILISIIVLIGWKKANPDVSLRNPLILFGIVFGISLIAFFKNKFFKKIKKDDLPEPMDETEIEEKIKEEFEKRFWFNIRKNGGINCIDTNTVNKNEIYAYEVMPDEDGLKFQDNKVNSVIAIINANYKHKPVLFLNSNMKNKLKNIMNRMSFNPKEDPDEESRTETDLSTGKQTTYKKKTSNKEDKKEEKSDIE